MSQLILLKVQNYLSELLKGEGKPLSVSDALDFGNRSAATANRYLSPERERAFRLRMSNLGRPGCVLEAEKLEVRRNPATYNDRMRNMYGDMVETVAIAIMKKAGVNIVREQGQVSAEFAGHKIDGTYDCIIAEPDPKVYDIKSASSYAFANKYRNKTLQQLWDDGDTFGYVTQLYCYSKAAGVPVGGLIVVNKETGEWLLVEPPIMDDELRKAALKRAEDNVTRLTTDKPFTKDYGEEDEVFRKQKTGNRVLGSVCSFCPFMQNCWPDAGLRPQVVSKGASPRRIWYTHIEEKYLKNDDTRDNTRSDAGDNTGE